mmetsp:Transcript_11918/g.28944  ORF Transcript_11918/g.28944 Transcript_11918/m.28944 type:complete len:213 (+) Transcript_11918:5172-5810(+)
MPGPRAALQGHVAERLQRVLRQTPRTPRARGGGEGAPRGAQVVLPRPRLVAAGVGGVPAPQAGQRGGVREVIQGKRGAYGDAGKGNRRPASRGTDDGGLARRLREVHAPRPGGGAAERHDARGGDEASDAADDVPGRREHARHPLYPDEPLPVPGQRLHQAQRPPNVPDEPGPRPLHQAPPIELRRRKRRGGGRQRGGGGAAGGRGGGRGDL